MTEDARSVREPRELWVDNLRVLVVAGVIVVHTATAYITGIADWYYDERTTSTLWSTVLAFPVVAGGLFGLGPLFLLAGWFAARSIARRGPRRFALARLLRLGGPLVVFLLLVQPLADVVGSRADEEPIGFASALRTTEFSVMWFVAALLVFSLVYALVRRVRTAPAPRLLRVELLLAVAALTIAATSYAVWQLWPWNSEAFRSLRVGEWPQGAVLFALGARLSSGGSLSRGVVRRLGWAALVLGTATLAMFAVLDARDEAEPVLDQAAGWPTVLFALLDGLVAVSLSVWFVCWIRRRWPTHGHLVGSAGRGSYAAYLIHPLALTTLMVLLAPVELSPELKFLLLAPIGTSACLALGYALTRLPILSKAL